MKLPSKVAIIGCGASGIFMAEQLQKLAKEQNKTIQIKIFEKESHVGGKCYTYRDSKNSDLRSEYGAGAIAANYGIVIDAMNKYDQKFEYMLPSENTGIDFSSLISDASMSEKATLIQSLLHELSAFNQAYLAYKQAKDNKQALPENFEKPFSEFCELMQWTHMEKFMKPLVPGFGYGDLSHCPTYSILEYMGKTTISSMILNDFILHRPALLAMKGGFQSLIESMAKSHDVLTSVNIQSIDRSNDSITITYQKDSDVNEEQFDCLVLANSPMHWPSLGMKLTDIEQQCVDNLSYYRYPVAIVKIQGLPTKQYFFPEALEQKGFGHVALITTRDNRSDPKEGRLCTIYVNQLPGENQFNFKQSWPQIVEDIKSIDGVTNVDLIEEQYWPDYLPSLSWDLRLKLDEQQAAKDTNTIYLGAYTLGTFEDVISNANNAYRLAETIFGKNYRPVENFSFKEARRALSFYGQAYKPMDDTGIQEKEMRGCTIL